MSALFALVLVTNAGMVSLTPGFTTEALCLDAKSIAETGRTVREVAEDLAKATGCLIEPMP